MIRYSIVLLSCLLLAPLCAAAQEAAGRVLTSVGDVAVVRGPQRIAAQRGTQLQSGDQIEVGAASNAQIYLTDETVIALRADTTFRLTEYAFQGPEEGQRRAFFDLIKGGMRTITGAIGKIPRSQDYRVTTPTSTIGIRGTHYKLAHTPEGTYGGVTDGRIAVTNRSGEAVFGSDQFFRVADVNTRPQQLIGPPSILNDRLEGRGKPRTGSPAPSGTPSGTASTTAEQQTQTSSTGAAAGTETTVVAVVAQTGATGGTGDTRSSGAVTSTATTTSVSSASTSAFQSNTAATTQGPATVVQPTLSGTVAYRLQGPFNLPLSGGRALVNGDITLGVNLSLQLAAISANLVNAAGERANLGTPFGPAVAGIPVTVSNGQVSFGATYKLADFPNNQGSFRCSSCGPGNTPGFFDSISISGTISGSTANVTLTGTDAGGPSSFSATLTQQTPPNNDVAAIVTPRSGGGADARSQAFWNVQLDSARKLTDFGPTVGQIKASVGTATNTVLGSSPASGNLVWGAWTGAGAQVTDFNYASFTTTAGAFLPWITGDAPNTLPPSLGVLTYTPVGSALGGGVFNAGSLTADFVNRTMAISLNATNPSARNTFQMNGSSAISSINGRFSAGFSSVTCSGPCTGGTPGGSFGGFIAGQNAEGAGVAFTAGFGISGTGVSGVVGFKR